MARLRECPHDHLVWVSPIVLAEVEFGLRITETSDAGRRAACRRFINSHALDFVHDIGPTIRESYAEIMENIWANHPPGNGGVRTQHHLCIHSVDVNDIWICAVALQHNLTLLTADQMATIKTCVPHLRIENWLV